MSPRGLGPDFAQQAMRLGSDRLALIIGNGVNRHMSPTRRNDWGSMIRLLARKYGLSANPPPSGLALTELFDLITLASTEQHIERILQREFCDAMSGWKPVDHHSYLMAWAKRNGTPVLTTNFDHMLADAAGATLRSMFQKQGALQRPTDFYPWEKYFSHQELNDPCDGFGIWHVNGLVHHVRSIRLGLSHYMGSVSRAQPWLLGAKASRLFEGANQANWRGRNTWLHVVFNMPLLIFGLELGPQEVFLRWLLIQRSKYFRKFPDRRQPAWYVYPGAEEASRDKLYFLERIGITPWVVRDYEAIYDSKAWR
jgi:hypothetical protein